ncbi:DUF551 domain-containing protein [Klebsiella quasivariicola]|uniref:DUF551 domain-containing protein n=1 Tax=Klebsiella quasivariicola TaxID=2026240 RepID=UPI003969E657
MTSKLTRERLAKIKSWRETYGAGSNVMLPSEEAEELACLALAAMDSEPVEMPLDYLQGHKDGLEWAARLAEANHPDTGDWLYDDPIELAKAIRKGPDMPPVQPVADSEPDRNPVLAYADSYRDMAKQGVESVPIWSVITDLERNIAPLYRHAQPAVVSEKIIDNFEEEFRRAFEVSAAVEQLIEIGYQGDKFSLSIRDAATLWKLGRAAMLAAATQSPGSEPAAVPGKWIPVSERMPEDRAQVILWDAEIGEVTSGHYSHKTQTFYHCGDAIENEITHWMPLPAAPREVK